MSKRYVNPPNLFPSLEYGFSQIVVTEGGSTVYLSGQVGWDATKAMPGSGDFGAQTLRTFENIERAMRAAGGAMADVVSMRIYIVEEHLDESHLVRNALKHHFAEDHAPATTWIGVRALASKEFLIEIEAVAVMAP